MTQLILPFIYYNQKSINNFIGNKELILFLQSLFNLDESKIVYIYSKHGLGKTYLLQSYCNKIIDLGMQTAYIDCNNFKFSYDMLDIFIGYDWLFIDNINKADKLSQYILFSLYNYTKFSKLKFIITGDTVPNLLQLELNDLKTRLSFTTIFQLENLTDSQKKQILIHNNKANSIVINDNFYNYLLKNYSRNLAELLTLITNINKYSIQEHKPISIFLLKKYLTINRPLHK